MVSWCGRAGEFPSDRPSVHLFVDPSVDNSVPLWIGAGCEEEGVPLSWEERPGDADALARAAAARSRLEVGVGLDGTGGAVALAKIPQRAYVVHPGTDRRTLRFLGQAAARLAKGEPVPRKAPPGAEVGVAARPEDSEIGAAPSRSFPEGDGRTRLLVEAVLKALAERPGGRDGSA